MTWRIASCAVAAAVAFGTMPAQAEAVSTIPAPTDLQREAAQAVRAGKPLVLFFSLPDCRFCHVVRLHYLLPMLRDLPPAERPVIREIDMASETALIGFDRRATTHRALAKSFGVRLAPTVLFLDQAGNRLADPIVGGDTTGMYGGYLDNAFAAAALRLSAGARNARKSPAPARSR